MDFDNSTGLPSLDDTFGAVLIGSFVGFAIYGLSVHHAYRYFRFYPEDAIVLKALVTWVMTLETLSAVLSLHACYHYVVSSYFEPAQLVYGIWSLSIYPLLSGIIMVSSQGYFARRVWIIGARYRLAVVFAIALCVVELGFLTAATAMACIVATWNQYYGVTWLLSTGYTTAVVADSIVTGLLIYVLHCNRTGVKRTDSMIDIMILYAVNTGLLTGVMNLLCLVFAFARPQDLYYVGIGIVSNRSYALTLLVALNSRISLRRRGCPNMSDPSLPSMVHQPRGTHESPRYWRTSAYQQPSSTHFSGDIIELQRLERSVPPPRPWEAGRSTSTMSL